MIKNIILTLNLFLLFSCNYKSNTIKTTENNIAFSINNTKVSVLEIDNKIQQELYDELYRIYIIRKTVIDNEIKEKVLDLESNKIGLSKIEYLEKYYKKIITKDYINNYKIKLDKLPELKRTLKYYDVNTKKGQELLIKGIKKRLLKELIDSLKAIYKPKIYLTPPLPPSISLEQIHTNYRGNLESDITFIEISDLECSKCREYYPIYNRIYNKYKDRVKFGFINYSSYATLSAIALNCAYKQNKFWEMHDSIMQNKHLLDTNEILSIAKNLNMNLKQFKLDLNKPETTQEIEYNSKLIMQYGIYATPTILINGKPVFDSSSETQIEQIVLNEINK